MIRWFLYYLYLLTHIHIHLCKLAKTVPEKGAGNKRKLELRSICIHFLGLQQMTTHSVAYRNRASQSHSPTGQASKNQDVGSVVLFGGSGGKSPGPFF